MRITLSNAFAIALLAAAPFASLKAADVGANDAKIAEKNARLEALEARLLDLEARLAENEQTTKEVKVLAANSSSPAVSGGNASTFGIMANSAWRNLRWTQEAQWEGIRPGLSEAEVIEQLGAPPRTVKSVRPRVDEVFYYETSIRDRVNSLRGTVSFRHGTVVSVEKPNFKSLTHSAN